MDQQEKALLTIITIVFTIGLIFGIVCGIILEFNFHLAG